MKKIWANLKKDFSETYIEIRSKISKQFYVNFEKSVRNISGKVGKILIHFAQNLRIYLSESYKHHL